MTAAFIILATAMHAFVNSLATFLTAIFTVALVCPCLSMIYYTDWLCSQNWTIFWLLCSQFSEILMNYVFPDHVHAVQVCDIVAVSKTKDDDQINTETRRSRKKVEQLYQLYPNAFTGIKPTLVQKEVRLILHVSVSLRLMIISIRNLTWPTWGSRRYLSFFCILFSPFFKICLSRFLLFYASATRNLWSAPLRNRWSVFPFSQQCLKPVFISVTLILRQ